MKGRKPVYQSEKLSIILPRLYVARIRDEEAGRGISGYIREALEEVWGLRPRRILNKFDTNEEFANVLSKIVCSSDNSGN